MAELMRSWGGVSLLSGRPEIVVASACTGVAAAWLAWWLMRLMYGPRRRSNQPWEFETVRRDRLRKVSPVYRNFEPLIDEIAPRVLGGMSATQSVELQRRLAGADLGAPWTPGEFVAVKWLESLPAAIVGGAIGYFAFGPSPTLEAFLGLAVGAIGLAWIYQHFAVRSAVSKAAGRSALFKRRLPFAIDLMAFMMEAGAGFLDALQTVVAENRDHPLGQELGIVLRQVALGQRRRDALDQLTVRLRDEDVDELVRAINHGEDLGSPLSETLRRQADQMRLKRAQWGEKAAAEAQVAIVFPGMLIMLACLALIAAPFLLAYLNEGV